jgi:hypothetical protein
MILKQFKGYARVCYTIVKKNLNELIDDEEMARAIMMQFIANYTDIEVLADFF